ncbi:MAG: helix-turn-helix transcriptional regulator [Spirochaetota bacterium]|nr:MAG: helix-turn-helix transcriptional regulator [Spirochaetota bacterium]
MGKRIGEVIREKRGELHLKQEELAERAGLGGVNSKISIIELSRMPKFDVACRIAYALQMTPNELAKAIGIKVYGET